MPLTADLDDRKEQRQRCRRHDVVQRERRMYAAALWTFPELDRTPLHPHHRLPGRERRRPDGRRAQCTATEVVVDPGELAVLGPQRIVQVVTQWCRIEQSARRA